MAPIILQQVAIWVETTTCISAMMQAQAVVDPQHAGDSKGGSGVRDVLSLSFQKWIRSEPNSARV